MVEGYLQKSKKYKGYHYSVLTEEQIEYLHNTTLKIFKEIVEILNENNIPYIIVGGTLLGAYTTGKFIPWDDDLDVCIFEKDYSRTIKLLSEELSNWILVQNNETEPNYFHGWVKVRDKYSCVLPKTDSYSCNGVWVDLYCIKEIKRKNQQLEIINEHLSYLKRRFEVGDISENGMTKRIIDNNLEERLLKEKEIVEKSKDESTIYQIQSASKIHMEPEWIFPLKTVEFEGLSVTTINSPEDYLIQHYGENYIKLPPDELRRVGIYSVQKI